MSKHDSPRLYEALIHIRAMNDAGERVEIVPGAVFGRAQVTEAFIEDAVKQPGWLRVIEQITPEQARGEGEEAPEAPEVPAEGAAPPAVVTRTSENLDPEALAALDLDSLLVSVVERVKTDELKRPVADSIKGMSDPKASAIAFLTSSFEDQAEFISHVEKLADEEAALNAPLVDEPEDEEVDGATPPKNMLGE